MNYLVSNDTKSLYKAFLSLKNEEECKRFLRDLLTKQEIQEFTNRWKVARLLDAKVQYKKIEKQTGMSSTTIARISKWLTNGMKGYRLILDRLNNMNNESIRQSSTLRGSDPNGPADKNEDSHHTPSRGGVIFSA